MFSFITLIFLGFVVNTANAAESKLLVIFMDGFRWDYLTRFKTPNFDKMIAQGVQAEHLNPIFPAFTLPNTYTHFTGLYPESHGIVSNDMYDPATGKTFELNYTEARNWLQVPGIWDTFAAQNVKYSQIPDTVPSSDYEPFKQSKEAVRRLSAGDDVVWMYFSNPDSIGHDFGPYSRQINIVEIDEALGQIFDDLEKLKILNDVNIMIFGDHGMALVPKENQFNVSVCLNNANIPVTAVFAETAGNVYVPEKSVDAAYNSLKNCHDNLKVYKVQDVPEHLHYRNNPRIGQLVLIADEGWFGVTTKSFAKYPNVIGRHGYPFTVQDMQTIFIARGPSFRQNHRVPAFSMIHIYALICHVTGVTPAPNNGSVHVVRDVLEDPPTSTIQTTTTSAGVLKACFLIVVFSGLVAVWNL